LFLLLALGVLSPTTSNALSSVAPPKNNVIAITHASGRMGKLLALQLREDACNRYQSRIQTTEDDDDDDTSSDEETKKNDMEEHLPRIRAIVRSDQEAYSVRCDLGGMKMVGGAAQPMPCDWLETVVVDHSKLDVSQREELLRTAFEGCKAAVLCDASHNELVWTEECSVEENGSIEYNEDCGSRVVVPVSESRDLSKRLLEEIDATKHSTTLEHVVLRSTMGLDVSEAARAHDLYLKQQPAIPMESDVDWKALANAMGGEAALSGPRAAETAFGLVANAKSTSKSRKHTILRLGALTDDPGMVPLVFGRKDSILIKAADDGTQNYNPPILSRSDAARISMMLVRSDDENNANDDGNANSNNDLLTIDCAWHPSYGRDSVGREEVVSEAARQNLDIRAIYFDSMWNEKYFIHYVTPLDRLC